jgi:non-specific serine/threonine protein kinase
METIGKYRILREIGKGATATVYLVVDPARPRDKLALKYISFKTEAQDGGQWTRRLRKLLRTEWSVMHGLDHPNIIHIFDTVIEDDFAYLVMEYVDGTTLEPYCSFEGLLPMHRTVGIIFKTCLALDYAYQRGIVHRDIKPANILVDANDNVKLTDFGLALNVQKNKDTDSTFIMGVGSPSYMSPEQIKGYPLNQKTDLYSLGVVLFHMLTGRLPFRAKTPAQLIYKIINADPPRPSQLNPEVPPQMDAIIKKALEKDLYSRYKNGAELAKDLSAVRYRIVDDSYVQLDTTRFNVLRKLSFFMEFDDVELWEVLRMGLWREMDEFTLMQQEGIAENRLRILIKGQAELSLNGRRLANLGPGEPVGELMYLDTLPDAQHVKSTVTAVTLTPVTYLEFNPAALALATEDCLEKFRQRLISWVVRRLAATQVDVAAQGEPATKPVEIFGGLELALVEEAAPPAAELQPEAPPSTPEAPQQAAPEPNLDAFGGLSLALEEEGTPPPESHPAPQPDLDTFADMYLSLEEDSARPEASAFHEPEPPSAPGFELEPVSLPEPPPAPSRPPATGART